MTDIERYNTKYKDLSFCVANDTEKKMIYVLGYLDDDNITILHSDRSYCGSYHLTVVLNYINSDIWILDKNSIRKKKLEKLMNGFSRKI